MCKKEGGSPVKKMNIKKLLPYLVLYIMVFVFSLGGICSKLAAQQTYFSFEWFLLYGLLLLSLAVYALTWQQILKIIPLNVAYTVKSVGVIWTMLWGKLIFHERLTWLHLVSAAFIIAGVILMTTTGKKEDGGASA